MVASTSAQSRAKWCRPRAEEGGRRGRGRRWCSFRAAHSPVRSTLLPCSVIDGHLPRCTVPSPAGRDGGGGRLASIPHRARNRAIILAEKLRHQRGTPMSELLL